MIAIIGSMPKVNGTINARPVDAERPGMTPTKMPIVTPHMMTRPGCHQGIVSVPSRATKPSTRCEKISKVLFPA